MTHVVKLTTLVVTAGLVAGCGSKDSMLPRPQQSMQDVYYNAMGSIGQGKLMEERSTLRRSLTEADTDYSTYVRTEASQLQAQFRHLPNPTLYMFVAPHLTTNDGVPIPGYLTEFKLYTQDHYALPGEINQATE